MAVERAERRSLRVVCIGSRRHSTHHHIVERNRGADGRVGTAVFHHWWPLRDERTQGVSSDAKYTRSPEERGTDNSPGANLNARLQIGSERVQKVVRRYDNTRSRGGGRAQRARKRAPPAVAGRMSSARNAGVVKRQHRDRRSEAAAGCRATRRGTGPHHIASAARIDSASRRAEQNNAVFARNQRLQRACCEPVRPTRCPVAITARISRAAREQTIGDRKRWMGDVDGVLPHSGTGVAREHAQTLDPKRHVHTLVVHPRIGGRRSFELVGPHFFGRKNRNRFWLQLRAGAQTRDGEDHRSGRVRFTQRHSRIRRSRIPERERDASPIRLCSRGFLWIRPDLGGVTWCEAYFGRAPWQNGPLWRGTSGPTG